MSRAHPSQDSEERPTKRHRTTGPATSSPSAFSPLQLMGGPEVWAADRQSLCETLPSYRSYQGAVYHADGQLKGVLLSGDGGWGHLGPATTIFRAPGKSDIGKDGEKVQIASHSWEEAAVRAMFNAWAGSHIFFIFISAGHGVKNSLVKIDLPHPICSLGAFWLTDLWPTMLDGKLSIWCKAQKVDAGLPSWWARDTVSPLISSAPVAEEPTCSTCGKPSQRIYEQMWLCLNDRCDAFFSDGSGKKVDLRSLDLYKSFVNRYKPFPHDMSTVPPLVPPLPDINSGGDSMWWMRETATRGVVCRGCGQCLPRKWFKGWICDHCGWQLVPVMQPVTIDQLLDCKTGDDYAEPKSALPQTRKAFGAWRMTSIPLGGNESISLFQSNGTINSAPGGSNDLFIRLQQDLKADLKRFTLHNRASTAFLASHYTINFGMPYKYVVVTDSKAFSVAPDPILEVVARLKWATQQMIGAAFGGYNELLAVGYFAGNKMGFHDDGEKDLGPNVSSLSLGSDSIMAFRVKKKYHTGYTGKNFAQRQVIKEKYPIPPNAFLASERQQIDEQKLPIDQHVAALKEMYDSYWANLVSKHGEKGAKYKIQTQTVNRNIIEFKLRHGDMVVMSGHGIQKYLEHGVSSIPGLRFALTCREIEGESVEAAHIPQEKKAVFDGLAHHFEELTAE